MREVFSTATRLRIGLAAVVVFVSAIQGLGVVVLPWALLVVAFDVVAGYLMSPGSALLPQRTRPAALAAISASGCAAGLALLAGPVAVPLVVVPLFRGGERRKTGVVLAFAGAAAGAALAVLLSPAAGMSISQMVMWTALAVALGVLAAWEDSRTTTTVVEDPATGEAALLLARLAELSSSLEGGLDPALLAERVIEALPEDASRRSALLVGDAGGHAVPVALRGATRVPWAQPTSDPAGIIGSAWCSGKVSYGFAGGRALVAAPIIDPSGRQVAVLVTDRIADVGPDQDEVAEIRAAGERHAASLSVAISYASLREEAGLEERRDLARLMHDGVAQEVAALGFQLDLIRYAAQAAGDSVADELGSLRGELARILDDVRANITDLRVGLRPEHGLGAAVSARLQQYGTTTGAVVKVSLDESGFRLPAATEMRLYRLMLDVLADAHRHAARSVEVELAVSAPHYRMIVRHDARTSVKEIRLRERLEGEADVQLQVDRDDDGTTVTVTLAPSEPTYARPRKNERRRLAVAS
ncbi:MAG TPA: histidine kinase [Dermatophilaceae bacterium]|mgnify:CR=1 FL=1|nr:histidine kinase [Dermatophilaceae bacterium]